MNPDRPTSFAARSLARLDRLQWAAVVAIGVALGGGAGGAGFFLGEAPAWAIFWLALFAGIYWLGYTATPVFDERRPDVSPPRPRRVCDGELLMVDLPGGDFRMGSPASDDLARDDEKPQHQVTLAPFRMAVTPVTAELYREVMGQASTGDDPPVARLPATGVSWLDAVEFCNRLSVRAGYRPCYSRGLLGGWRCDWRADGYRLPTEAEWEYACRAGSTSRFCFGDDPAVLDAYAWYEGNAKGAAQPVATRRANAWGLYDMHGNVWEWCWDWYGSYSSRPARSPRGPIRWKFWAGTRVLRGGSFVNQPASLFVYPPALLRSADRFDGAPEYGHGHFGFRCVRVPPQHVDRSTH
ncbi:MAG: formylglycine-generating enzyme family protein [Candidatus Accumulibacter sp. UW27]|uniref:formylglycine-generating enzyme family protein n=1 Tax=Accumulibacter sp. TaxID=2053492 RepID=UPI00258C3602|nr:formylglycine-generating enzyme family protein [Accumulibacter sp.]HRF11404.1 formylglycine-generating enzyme family protein [Candidatus Accumulibacter phosphatis]